MNWKEQLENFEYNKNWKPAIDLIQKIIAEDSSNIEAYIRAIYLIHNILLEENYPDEEHDRMSGLLKRYFDDSYKKFSEDAEYLFFIGKILYIAEWYFGLNDDLKPIEERLAFRMQKKAFEKEPDNTLYEWAYRFSLPNVPVTWQPSDPKAWELSEQLLFHQPEKLAWLATKGFPGQYILDSITWCYKQYRNIK